MGYVVYTRSLQVNGFRPGGQTNPFAAAMLSGVGPYASRSYRQRQLFSASGGSLLRGLGMMVPDQAVVNYQGQWTAPFGMGSEDLINQVTANLQKDGLLVRGESNTASAMQKMGTPLFSPEPFGVTLQLQVNNGLGYGDPNDIISIIRHEVYLVSGVMPNGDSIPSVKLPMSSASPAGDTVSTGQPEQAVSTAAASSSDLGSWLAGNLGLIALGAAVVLLVPNLLKR